MRVAGFEPAKLMYAAALETAPFDHSGTRADLRATESCKGGKKGLNVLEIEAYVVYGANGGAGWCAVGAEALGPLVFGDGAEAREVDGTGGSATVEEQDTPVSGCGRGRPRPRPRPASWPRRRRG